MLCFPEERALTGPDCHVECALFNFGVLKNAMAQAGENTECVVLKYVNCVIAKNKA